MIITMVNLMFGEHLYCYWQPLSLWLEVAVIINVIVGVVITVTNLYL